MKIFTRFFKKLKINKKKKNSGESPYEIVSFLTVRRRGPQNFFFTFVVPIPERFSHMYAALPGLRPFISPLNGLGLRPRYAWNKK